MIVLTADEAAKVIGRSPEDGGAVLIPVPLKDGAFMLGEQVLDDPAHEDVRDLLAGLPRLSVEKLPVYTAEDEPGEVIEAANLQVRGADIPSAREAEVAPAASDGKA